MGLARPVTKGMRVLPQADLERLHRTHVAQEARWSRWSPARRRRVGHHILGAVVCMSLVNALLVPLPPGAALVQLPVYAIHGLVVGLRSPGRFEAGALTLLAGMAIVHLAGGGVPLVILVPACAFWFLVGVVVGVDQEAKAWMGPLD